MLKMPIRLSTLVATLFAVAPLGAMCQGKTTYGTTYGYFYKSCLCKTSRDGKVRTFFYTNVYACTDKSMFKMEREAIDAFDEMARQHGYECVSCDSNGSVMVHVIKDDRALVEDMRHNSMANARRKFPGSDLSEYDYSCGGRMKYRENVR